MGEHKCKCGDRAKLRIYTDSEMGNFVDCCQKCADKFKKDLEDWKEDETYRQGRSLSHYNRNIRLVEIVVVAFLLILATIVISKIIT